MGTNAHEYLAGIKTGWLLTYATFDLWFPLKIGFVASKGFEVLRVGNM